ncbi:RDD family protein [Frateuria sp. STR12]|uniref:RDD family protein n=1 Tax=Frateuria hangzhouensis TaxID=2995589 RepID=UPI002260917C|nr:RDD family protein [Frateuria sp. STR12]MCX7512522.1 RDD family protein [Frateuria sp. STR12]
MEIWIGRDGQRHGPYKEEDVRLWLREGKLAAEDLGWYEGLADWQPLSVLFRDALAAAPPVPADAHAPAMPPPTTTASLEDYAGFWKRLAAYIIDIIVLYVPNMLIMQAFGNGAAQARLEQALLAASTDPNVMLAAYGQYYETMRVGIALTAVLAWLYFALCESSKWQATVGKLAMGIRVTDLEGRRISFWRALGRYAAKILSWMIVAIGFLMIAWTRRKQGLHDMLANTLVLNGRASAFHSPAPRDDRSFHA